MKNFLNCHSIGLHSFPIEFKDNLYKRIFYATPEHNLYLYDEIAIHPHHVDIKISVLDGTLINKTYKQDSNGELYNKYKWNSEILNGNGGFKYLEIDNLSLVSNQRLETLDSVYMKADELHTVYVPKYKLCVWLIEEFPPTGEYNGMTYSTKDLTSWTSKDLYIEVDNTIKNQYIEKYSSILKLIIK